MSHDLGGGVARQQPVSGGGGGGGDGGVSERLRSMSLTGSSLQFRGSPSSGHSDAPVGIHMTVAEVVKGSAEKATRSSLITEGGLAILLDELLGGGPEHEAALSGLVNLSMCKDSRVDMYNRLQAVQGTLVSLMASSPRGSKTTGSLVNLFRNLSDTGGADNRGGMFNGGLAQALVGVISAEGGGDSEAVNSALNCLTNLAQQTGNRVAMLRAEGVLRMLVDVIKGSEPNSRPLRNALVTLTNLSCHKDNRLPMMTLGVADLLITLTLTAGPDSKHLEAVLIMLVNLSAMEQCRLPLVRCGAAEAALAVISSCRGSSISPATTGPGTQANKNCEISLKIVQNLSASGQTGGELVAQGVLDEALRCARSEDEKVSAVAAGVLSNLALFAKGEASKSGVRDRMLEAGVTSALQGLMDRRERTGLSAAKAAAYLFGGGEGSDHPLLRACGPALGRLCNALHHTLDGKELYGVTFDVYELLLAIRDICVLRENRVTLVAEGGIPLLIRVTKDHESRSLRDVMLALQTLAELAEDAETAHVIRRKGDAALAAMCHARPGHGLDEEWGVARSAAQSLQQHIGRLWPPQ